MSSLWYLAEHSKGWEQCTRMLSDHTAWSSHLWAQRTARRDLVVDYYYLLKAYSTTAQGHLRDFHKIKSDTSWIPYKACTFSNLKSSNGGCKMGCTSGQDQRDRMVCFLWWSGKLLTVISVHCTRWWGANADALEWVWCDPSSVILWRPELQHSVLPGDVSTVSEAVQQASCCSSWVMTKPGRWLWHYVAPLEVRKGRTLLRALLTCRSRTSLMRTPATQMTGQNQHARS